MSKSNPVGRPAGVPNRRTPVAQRVRNLLTKFGVLYPTSKVKARLLGQNGKLSRRQRIKDGTSLDVQIAQVRSKMIREATGLAQTSRGRRSLAETQRVEVALSQPVAA